MHFLCLRLTQSVKLIARVVGVERSTSDGVGTLAVWLAQTIGLFRSPVTSSTFILLL